MKTIEEVKAIINAAFKYDIDLYWHVDDSDEIRAAINVNDVFFCGCSDAEEVEVEDLPALEKAMEDGGYIWGSYLFVCRKRGMRPQGAWINAGVKNYKEFNARPFLDAGPMREIDVGNPEEVEG